MRRNRIERTRTTTTGAAALLASTLLASSAGIAQSANTAHLARADMNADGQIDWQDLNTFLTAFAARDRRADIDGNGRIDDIDTKLFMSVMGMRLSSTPTPPAPPAAPAPPSSAPPAGDSKAGGAAPAPTGEYRTEFASNSLRFAQGQREILSHTGPVYMPHPQNGAPGQVSVVQASNGFDLVVRVTNTTRRPQRVGSVVLDGFRLGQAVTARDFRGAGAEIALSDEGAGAMRSGVTYPSGWYSPVFVAHDEVYTLGVSLQYPVLEYKHEVKFGMAPSGSFYRMFIEFNPAQGGVGYSKDGEIKPGETRQYVVSLRAQPRNSARWTDTLQPYREYFTSAYGDTSYVRDPRPVHAAVMASPGEQTPDNPRGFLFNDLRPDVHGFGPWLSELRDRAELGWDRVMIWRPSGLPYSGTRSVKNTGCGMFDFVSSLDSNERLRDAFTELPRFNNRARDLGVWWGDPLKAEGSRRGPRLNLDSARDREDALREATRATGLGAEMVGLNDFNKLPAWQAYGWLRELRQANPGVTYITSPACGDLIHTLAPAMLVANAPSSSPSTGVDTRFFLADYLVPGHETWGLIRVDRLGSPHDDGIRDEIFRIVEKGFVPVVVPPLQIDRRVVAEETWRMGDDW
ncbi:MAG: hypothetical protein KF684_14005 [Phycisphaeraceae bacterium]|nr:hypothetical protein [Phycisphaeraceae bacterium]